MTLHLDNQSTYTCRFDWGLAGLQSLAPASDVVVIVDVLSFSTSVDVAAARGAEVLPYPWEDNSAQHFAQEQGASLAVTRGADSAAGGFSLSPCSLLTIPAGHRLVLPSPNGATLAYHAGEACRWVLCGSLRNARAIASAAKRLGHRIAVVAAGERWPGPEKGLRPALEDLLGAGAILSSIEDRHRSPEADSAVRSFRGARSALFSQLLESVSGRELVARGFRQDVELASQIDSSAAVPVLVRGAFIGMPESPALPALAGTN
ncbi:MAG: 2-phosphosulfolactate phosphatase [Candidatus Sericytochromatia bacterium]|nr:2-phosphosulfolactate phosphatase [Candidatus Tanganyikabacteria bacterium]